MLGATPNHLTLSTASTLSAGSTGSAAKLIQASSTPGKLSSAPPPPEPSKLTAKHGSLWSQKELNRRITYNFILCCRFAGVEAAGGAAVHIHDASTEGRLAVAVVDAVGVGAGAAESRSFVFVEYLTFKERREEVIRVGHPDQSV